MKANRCPPLLPRLAVLCAPGAAQGYNANFFGPRSCGEVVAALRARNAHFNRGDESVRLAMVKAGETVVAWVFGYLTGRNYERDPYDIDPDKYADLGNALGSESLALWLTNWCTQNSL